MSDSKSGTQLHIQVEEVELMNTKTVTPKKLGWHAETGRTVIEMLVVVIVGAILTAVTVPQVISARRLLRSAQFPREVVTHLRNTRQQAMSQRQAITFQYDDATKQVKIIDHNNNENPNVACNVTWTVLRADASFPLTACSTTSSTIPLTGGPGIPTSELSFGAPAGVSGTATTLDDTSVLTALPASNKVFITFQPDGTVLDNTGAYANPTLFFYNNKASTETAAAISVLGSAGRVKVWRYDTSASKYVE